MLSAPAEQASPHLRTHRSTPRLRASPASKRHHLATTSKRPAATFPRIKKSQRQSTLTQLDFVPSTFDRDSDDDLSNKEAEWGTPVPKKRRRVNRSQTGASDSQNTLTQMSFLVCPDSQTSESESVMERDEDMMDPETVAGEHEQAIKAEPESPRLASPWQRGKPFEIAEDPSPTIKQEQFFNSADRIMDTPRKQAKAEIPSSQSPAPTPLSGTRSIPGPASLSKRQRSMLGEMTISELMRRDAQFENTPRKKTKRTAIVQDSCGEDDDELYDADAENVEPDWPPSFGKKTPHSKGNGEGSSRSGSSCGTRFEESQIAGLQGRHSACPSPCSVRNSQIKHNRLRDVGYEMDLERDNSPRCARRNRIASSPAGLQLEMRQEQNLNRVVACSPSPRRTLFKTPAPRLSARKEGSATRVSSSQATTVDFSLESPRRTQVPSSPLPPPVPTFDETQTQMLLQQQQQQRRESGPHDWSSMTAMTAIQSSAQLRTMSQLLRDSDEDEDDEEIFCTAE